MQIPARTYGACPNLLMTNPWIGAGTGAPGGAGTSRVQEASRLSGRPSTGICRNRDKTHPILRQEVCSCPEPGTVPLRAWAGTNAASALFAVRRHRPGRPRGARTRPGRVDAVCVVAARAERAARVAVALGRARALLARPAPRRSPGAVRRGSSATRRRCGASGPISPRRSRSRGAATGSPSVSSPPGCACCTSRATSSRSRSSSARRTSTTRSRASTT